jgi:uncharacterized protein YdhG (YjbR/CyaY superfamily)
MIKSEYLSTGHSMNAAAPASIDEYIDSFTPRVQPLLRKVRATIAKAAPGAQEAIKYNLPAFVLNGNLVFFGGFSRHIGLYAFPSAHRKFKTGLAKYKTGRGSVQFPYDKKIPYGLITQMVKFRVKENREKQKAKQRKAGKRGLHETSAR